MRTRKYIYIYIYKDRNVAEIVIIETRSETPGLKTLDDSSRLLMLSQAYPALIRSFVYALIGLHPLGSDIRWDFFLR